VLNGRCVSIADCHLRTVAATFIIDSFDSCFPSRMSMTFCYSLSPQ
jgi:hypothetical protein